MSRSERFTPASVARKLSVTRQFPHMPGSFTQGLHMHEGLLYESTGLVGRSSLRCMTPLSGEILCVRHVPRPHFAEGITVLGNEVFQLTWESGMCLVYDLATLRLSRVLSYEGEGWGLTTFENTLVMTNGSERIAFRDPHTFALVRELHVHDGTRTVRRLNDLAVVHDEIWANVWHTDHIARIDLHTGTVRGWLDLSDLRAHEHKGHESVLNGITWNEPKQTVIVTGKFWSSFYELSV